MAWHNDEGRAELDKGTFKPCKSFINCSCVSACRLIHPAHAFFLPEDKISNNPVIANFCDCLVCNRGNRGKIDSWKFCSKGHAAYVYRNACRLRWLYCRQNFWLCRLN